MAAKLTRNLKLRVVGGITDDALYNLERLDALGATFTINSRNETLVRSREDIIIEPQSQDVGGTGDGGIIHLGTSSHSIDSVEIWADVLNLNGSAVPTAADLSAKEDDLGLPPANGYILSSDTAGNRSWIAPSGGGGGGGSSNQTFTWLDTDGATRVINHSFDSTNLEVEVYDEDAGEEVYVDYTIVDSNSIQLNGISAPPATGYRVYVRETN